MRVHGLRALACAGLSLILAAAVTGCATGREPIPANFPADVRNWQGTLDRVEFVRPFTVDPSRGVRVEASSDAYLPKDDDAVGDPTRRVQARVADLLAEGVRSAFAAVPVETTFAPTPTASGSSGPASVPSGSSDKLVLYVQVDELYPGLQVLRGVTGAAAGMTKTTLTGGLRDGDRVIFRFEHTRRSPVAAADGGPYEPLSNDVREIGRRVGVLLNSYPTGK